MSLESLTEQLRDKVFIFPDEYRVDYDALTRHIIVCQVAGYLWPAKMLSICESQGESLILRRYFYSKVKGCNYEIISTVDEIRFSGESQLFAEILNYLIHTGIDPRFHQ